MPFGRGSRAAAMLGRRPRPTTVSGRGRDVPAMLQLAAHNALRSPIVSALLALGIALVSAGGVAVTHRCDADRRAALLVGGSAHAAGMLAVWVGVRLCFWRHPAPLPESLPVVLPVVGVAFLLFSVQWIAAAVLSLSYGLQSAVVWLVGVTWYTVYAATFVGNEGGALFALFSWVLVIGPATLTLLAVLAGGERVVRRRLSADRETDERTR